MNNSKCITNKSNSDNSNSDAKGKKGDLVWNQNQYILIALHVNIIVIFSLGVQPTWSSQRSSARRDKPKVQGGAARMVQPGRSRDLQSGKSSQEGPTKRIPNHGISLSYSDCKHM